ncbi:endonuclease/exonuclease/phosphatase family protein [Rosistilla oblonga]|uniref:endonuclease/exonuclease/phosphatase family protein n=1 Tax=Rosistilla oblonga TaxID=2527990 RepID=UPI003A96EFFE
MFPDQPLRWLLSFVLLCCLANTPVQLSAQSPTTLRVLSYNIHYGQGTDGVYDLERIARVIVAAKPDVVALQEVDVTVQRSGKVHQAQRLAELTGMAVRYGPTQHYQGGLFGNAVMTRMPIEDVRIQPLPYTDATEQLTTYPRGAIAVVVQSPQGQPVRFISTHFQHNVPGDRVAEADAINGLFATDNVPTVLAGDMNAVPGSKPIETLESRWKNAIDGEAAPSAPSPKPTVRIDYIFYRGETLKMVHSEVIDDGMASDHRPVLAVFELAK